MRIQLLLTARMTQCQDDHCNTECRGQLRRTLCQDMRMFLNCKWRTSFLQGILIVQVPQWQAWQSRSTCCSSRRSSSSNCHKFLDLIIKEMLAVPFTTMTVSLLSVSALGRVLSKDFALPCFMACVHTLENNFATAQFDMLLGAKQVMEICDRGKQERRPPITHSNKSATQLR